MAKKKEEKLETPVEETVETTEETMAEAPVNDICVWLRITTISASAL